MSLCLVQEMQKSSNLSLVVDARKLAHSKQDHAMHLDFAGIENNGTALALSSAVAGAGVERPIHSRQL